MKPKLKELRNRFENVMKYVILDGRTVSSVFIKAKKMGYLIKIDKCMNFRTIVDRNGVIVMSFAKINGLNSCAVDPTFADKFRTISYISLMK